MATPYRYQGSGNPWAGVAQTTESALGRVGQAYRGYAAGQQELFLEEKRREQRERELQQQRQDKLIDVARQGLLDYSGFQERQEAAEAKAKAEEAQMAQEKSYQDRTLSLQERELGILDREADLNEKKFGFENITKGLESQKAISESLKPNARYIYANLIATKQRLMSENPGLTGPQLDAKVVEIHSREIEKWNDGRKMSDSKAGPAAFGLIFTDADVLETPAELEAQKHQQRTEYLSKETLETIKINKELFKNKKELQKFAQENKLDELQVIQAHQQILQDDAQEHEMNVLSTKSKLDMALQEQGGQIERQNMILANTLEIKTINVKDKNLLKRDLIQFGYNKIYKTFDSDLQLKLQDRNLSFKEAENIFLERMKGERQDKELSSKEEMFAKELAQEAVMQKNQIEATKALNESDWSYKNAAQKSSNEFEEKKIRIQAGISKEAAKLAFERTQILDRVRNEYKEGNIKLAGDIDEQKQLREIANRIQLQGMREKHEQIINNSSLTSAEKMAKLREQGLNARQATQLTHEALENGKTRVFTTEERLATQQYKTIESERAYGRELNKLNTSIDWEREKLNTSLDRSHENAVDLAKVQGHIRSEEFDAKTKAEIGMLNMKNAHDRVLKGMDIDWARESTQLVEDNKMARHWSTLALENRKFDEGERRKWAELESEDAEWRRKLESESKLEPKDLKDLMEFQEKRKEFVEEVTYGRPVHSIVNDFRNAFSNSSGVGLTIDKNGDRVYKKDSDNNPITFTAEDATAFRMKLPKMKGLEFTGKMISEAGGPTDGNLFDQAGRMNLEVWNSELNDEQKQLVFNGMKAIYLENRRINPVADSISTVPTLSGNQIAIADTAEGVLSLPGVYTGQTTGQSSLSKQLETEAQTLVDQDRNPALYDDSADLATEQYDEFGRPFDTALPPSRYTGSATEFATSEDLQNQTQSLNYQPYSVQNLDRGEEKVMPDFRSEEITSQPDYIEGETADPRRWLKEGFWKASEGVKSLLEDANIISTRKYAGLNDREVRLGNHFMSNKEANEVQEIVDVWGMDMDGFVNFYRELDKESGGRLVMFDNDGVPMTQSQTELVQTLSMDQGRSLLTGVIKPRQHDTETLIAINKEANNRAEYLEENSSKMREGGKLGLNVQLHQMYKLLVNQIPENDPNRPDFINKMDRHKRMALVNARNLSKITYRGSPSREATNTMVAYLGSRQNVSMREQQQ
tara:strand:+ start:454 stop:4092 length:3639 start_codon:yes stop_codon:yes gene_type:complete